MRAAHLCIDVQNDERESAYYDTCRDEWARLEGVIKRMGVGFEKLGIPTLHVVSCSKSEGQLIGDLDKVQAKIRWAAHMTFTPCVERPQLATKNDYSCLTSKPIHAFLEKNKIDMLILSGVWEAKSAENESACVTKTAKDFANQPGKTAIIAAEATNGFHCLYHNAAILTMKQRRALHGQWGVEVKEIEAIYEALERRAERPAALSSASYLRIAAE
ncbi:MAG: isochorismatase family protein [Alphaproteobacteria bacterium]|nr:isochorismatase family protein [Alphaproteobacteria bacterium]